MPTFGWSLGKNDNASASSTHQSMTSSPPLPGAGGADSSGYIHADQNWTPEQQAAYEAAANSGNMAYAQSLNDAFWKDYDRRRAERASIAASWAAVGQNGKDAISGIDYNSRTGKWQYYDTKAKKWAEGNSIEDIYNTLFSEKQKAKHPLFYYQNQQQQADQGEQNRLLGNYRQAQSEALMASPSTRYQPLNF